MALFAKNPNEVAYSGGKKHFVDVIKNTGPGELLIWKQPEEDFNTNSTLIVQPGEEAIFINGGTIEQVFENGTYKLSTENYPFISRLRNSLSGGISAFNCRVYFVRKADSREIRWGTDSPIELRDKVWGIRTSARARGAYKLRIENPAKFLEKLIGNNVSYQLQDDITQYFESEFTSKIKSTITKFLNSLEQEFIGIDAYLDELSEQVQPKINEVFQDYGIKCVTFSIAGLDVDTSKYDEIDKAQINLMKGTKIAQNKVIQAQGDKTVMDTLGEDWGKQQAANILGNLSQNSGSGNMGTMGAGIGMGMAAGSIFGGMAQQMFTPMSNVAPGQQMQAQPTPPPQATQGATEADPMETLGKLKKMLDAGLIEQSEYDAKKAEILSRL